MWGEVGEARGGGRDSGVHEPGGWHRQQQRKSTTENTGCKAGHENTMTYEHGQNDSTMIMIGTLPPVGGVAPVPRDRDRSARGKLLENNMGKIRQGF